MNIIWRAEKLFLLSSVQVTNVQNVYYREDFYFVDRFHGSALHGHRCIVD
jgi:hypothetical protein